MQITNQQLFSFKILYIFIVYKNEKKITAHWISTDFFRHFYSTGTKISLF